MRTTLTDLGPGPIACDVAIAGAGAAGIPLALELKGQGLRVVLLEAGDTYPTDASQALYEGESLGLPVDLDAIRLRCLGGTTNHWGGLSHPLGAEVIVDRPYFAPGWPIEPADLQAAMPRALRYCEIDLNPGEAWDAPLAGRGAETFAGTRLEPDVWRLSPPTAFGTRWGDDLDAAPDVSLVLHAALTEIELSPDLGRVAALHVRGADGAAATIHPRVAVLAMNGIENPRLLLASNRQAPQGVGNAHDVVGRYFMGHPLYEPLALELAAGHALPRFFGTFDLDDGRRMIGMVRLKPEVQADLEVGSIDGAFNPGGQFGTPGVKALRRMLHRLQAWHLPDDIGRELAIVAGDLGGIARETMERLGFARSLDRFVLSVLVEQWPNPKSRVTLSDATDALGLPVVRLDWRLHERDEATVRAFARVVAEEVGRTGLGRAKLEPWVFDETAPFPRHANSVHLMGTTRMGTDPALSVVDPDCRVHGVDNLYVAGSSVFPTGGSVHPTLNLVALAVRLGDHLRERFGTAAAGGVGTQAALTP